jgi:hypothetical protein
MRRSPPTLAAVTREMGEFQRNRFDASWAVIKPPRFIDIREFENVLAEHVKWL